MSEISQTREDILGVSGPWTKVKSGLDTAPKEWWISPSGVAIQGSMARVKREAHKWSISDHKGRPKLLAHGDGFVVWGLNHSGSVERSKEPLEVLRAWRPKETKELTGSIREVLVYLLGENESASPDKLMKRCGIKRKVASRLLNRSVSIDGHWGDILGVVRAGWVVCSGDKQVCLSWGRSRLGFWEVDFAAVQIETAFGEIDIDSLGDSERMFLLFAALQEMNHNGDPETVKSIIAPWLTHDEPDMVFVSIKGPDWVDTSEWLPENGMVKPHAARWLLHHIHGVTLTTETLEVACTPPIRAGNKPQRRETMEVRRCRLFSRWFEGIQTDDTGLFSATPEALALELTSGASGIVFDATCGIGAIAISAARNPRVTKVIAVDTDSERLDMARHNAKIYEVGDRIEFVLGDSNSVIGRYTPDLVIADPPWGGRDWNRDGTNLESLNMDMRGILSAKCEVILKLPLSFDLSSLPGQWAPVAMVDSRGIIKFLKISRARLSP